METPYDVTITGEHDDRDEHNEIVFDTHEDEAAKSHAHHATPTMRVSLKSLNYKRGK